MLYGVLQQNSRQSAITSVHADWAKAPRFRFLQLNHQKSECRITIYSSSSLVSRKKFTKIETFTKHTFLHVGILLSTYLNFGAKKWPRNSVKFGLKNKKYMNFRAKIAKNTVNFGLKLHEFQNVKWNFYCCIIFGIRWICWWWCLKLVCIWLLCERQKKEPESSCHVKPSQWTPKCFCWLALLEKFYKAFTDKTAEQKQCS